MLEYVPIDKIPEWARHHGLERVRTGDFGRLGPVNIYWPKNENEKGEK